MSTLCLFLLAVTLGVHSQFDVMFTERRSGVGDCPIPDENTVNALISDSFNFADGIERPSVNVSELVIVCLAPGLFRGTINSFSVVVSYSCDGGPATCDGTSRTDQFQYDCNMDNTFMRAGIVGSRLRRPSVAFNLDPPRTLNEECGRCSERTNSIPADPLDHCVSKFSCYTPSDIRKRVLGALDKIAKLGGRSLSFYAQFTIHPPSDSMHRGL